MTAKNLFSKNTLLFTALAAALFAATPAFAQDVPPDSTETDAGVPKDRLVDEYADPLFAGDEVAAGDAVSALRTGGDFTVITTTTQQATNPDGTPATNPDGTPKMETVTVESAVANPNGPMGWGEVDHSLGLAQALVDNGQAAGFEEALLGAATTTTVTNPDGTTTTHHHVFGWLAGDACRRNGLGPDRQGARLQEPGRDQERPRVRRRGCRGGRNGDRFPRRVRQGQGIGEDRARKQRQVGRPQARSRRQG